MDDSEYIFTKAAVLGGSGFIGSNLVMYLLHMGNRLHLLTNRTELDVISLRDKISTYKGNIEDKDSLVECFKDCDIVFHLVGIIAESREKTFIKTIVEGTANVVSAAKECGIGKIVYLSALGVSENSKSRYFRSKWEAENMIISSGLDYTIFRPSIVYGHADKFINRIARMMKHSPVIPVIGDGKYRFQPLSVDELSALITLAGSRDFTSRKVYEIGGPQQLTYLEIINILKRVLGLRRIKIHLPIRLMRLIAAIMEKFLKPAPLTVDQLYMMQSGSICDNTIVEKEFGVEFSTFENKLQNYLRV